MGLYLILMGVQGAGKGVQAKFIQQAYGIPHVSTGDLFRAMRTREDDLARRVQELMSKGQLISDEITNDVVRERLEQPDAAQGVILDGYPRSRNQAEWLKTHLAGRGERVTRVLLLELDLFEAFKRAFGRISTSEGQSYNIYSNADGVEWEFVDHPEKAYPPQLNARLAGTDQALIRRADDANAHSIIKRIDTYLDTTMPLVEFYEQEDLVARIDASGSIETVGENIRQVIDAVQ
jgi:adenylate kinase